MTKTGNHPMSKVITATILALSICPTAAFAQATMPKTSPAVMDSASEAKFKAADKNNNGKLDGAELNAYSANMSKIDADKDGTISREEFASAVKSGTIK
jgi:Ca2+-binding EF-hand superfamily protein